MFHIYVCLWGIQDIEILECCKLLDFFFRVRLVKRFATGIWRVRSIVYVNFACYLEAKHQVDDANSESDDGKAYTYSDALTLLWHSTIEPKGVRRTLCFF